MTPKILNYFLLSVATLAMLSCEKQKEPTPPEAPQNLTIVASTDGAIVPSWKADDEFDVVVDSEFYTFSTTTAAATAEFTQAEEGLKGEMLEGKDVAAFYACNNIHGAFRIAAEQTYSEGVNSAKVPMYAYTMNSPVDNKLNLAFNPLASVLRLTIQGYDLNVEKLIITPAEGATLSTGALAGSFTVNASEGEVSSTTAINTITVTFPTALNLANGATVDIPLGWFSLSGGLQVVAVYDGTKEYTNVLFAEGTLKTFDESTGIAKAVVVEEIFEFDANSFPRNYYVSTTGNTQSKGINWSNPTTLSSALAAAVPGSVINIAAGAYMPEEYLTYNSGEEVVEQSESHKTFVINKNISIIGGYSDNPQEGEISNPEINSTVLTGNGSSYHTLIIAAPKVTGEKVSISGISIKGGQNSVECEGQSTTIGDAKLAATYAAGVAILNSDAKLTKVNISQNNGINACGLFVSNSEVEINECKISENISSGNGAGAWFAGNSTVKIDGSEVSGNNATGESIAAGLYFYTAEGANMEISVNNTKIISNSAEGNAGGMYLRNNNMVDAMNATISNCVFEGNSGKMGAGLQILNANAEFSNCVFTKNKGTGNGVFYLTTDSTLSEKVQFDNCKFIENSSTAIGGLYIYNNGGGIDVKVLNSAFVNNVSTGRGGAMYPRNNKNDANNQVKVLCVNCTMSGNTATSYGSAIDVYGDYAFVDLVSCTIAENTSIYKSGAKVGAALVVENKNTSAINCYNTIVANNIVAPEKGSSTEENQYVGAGAINNEFCFVGNTYFGEAGTEQTLANPFSFSEMMSSLTSNYVYKCLNPSTNPVIGNGMSDADLSALVSSKVESSIVLADQEGKAREDKKIVGACVSVSE